MRKLLSIALLLVLICGSVAGEKTAKVTKEVLGKHKDKEVSLFTLTNNNGFSIKLTDYGARIVQINVPDKNGNVDNVTMGSEKLESIVRDAFGGATIGRFANRIANGKFTLDGKEYTLPVNNQPNTLHGGRNGWFSIVWSSEILKGKQPAVKFSYQSPDGEEGFPGNVTVNVVYTWNDKNEIVIDYTATTDKNTVINLTNHAYFNLHGAGKGNVFDQILTINASAYTPVNAVKIPTGEIKSVAGTPFDFTSPHQIGYKIGETFNNEIFDGYDHNYVLDKGKKINATVFDSVSGRKLDVITDEPGLQFYSGNGMIWKRSLSGGNAYTNPRGGFALETQHFPDSPNQPGFPSTVLAPGKKFKSRTIYRFSAIKD